VARHGKGQGAPHILFDECQCQVDRSRHSGRSPNRTENRGRENTKGEGGPTDYLGAFGVLHVAGVRMTRSPNASPQTLRNDTRKVLSSSK
jgi:hypothetical protein